MHKTKKPRLMAAALSAALVLTLVPAQAGAAGMQPPTPNPAVSVHFFSRALTLDFGYQNSGWMDHITALRVDGVPYERVDSSLQLRGGTYVLQPSDGQIVLPPGLSGVVTCTIQADGYEELALSLDTRNHRAAVAAAPTPAPVPVPGQRDTDGITAGLKQVMSVYLKLTLTGAPGYVEGITGIRRTAADGQESALKQTAYKPALNGPAYFLEPGESAVYFDAMNPVFRSGDLLRISSGGYKDLVLKITNSGGVYQAQVVREETETPRPAEKQELHVRLSGAFEPALVDQKGYDAVTGATSTVSVNKNSSVEVQCALVQEGASPAEGDWVPLYKSGLDLRQKNVQVSIQPQDSGMTGVFSVLDSSLTLSGTPAKEGNYQISVTLTDDQGRKAVSNSLPFLVYGGDEKLSDRLTLSSAVQAQDGKYLYDMFPWSIRNFGGQDETVTVPAKIKAWFGSHTSGTYGRLGYALPEGREPVQTLLVPAGCDLTLVNMDLLSSVKVVVQDGGKLTLRDSAVQGVVEVEKGGTFSMNYDGYHGKFLTGASINGQLRLKGGAVLENAAIYSNTNFIANGSAARHNTRPVAAVLGDVTLKGQVFIKGDEAPTGTDPLTGRSYAGQTGLSVTGGTLTLADGALLAVYGGGDQAITSVGGTAIQLDHGTIAGSGTLAAVGGNGTLDRGGDAVSGTGSITVAKAYLQGGASAFPKSADTTGGLAAAPGVSAPNAVKHDGPAYRSDRENPNIPRWAGASAVPTQKDAQRLMDYVTGHAPAPAAPATPSTPTPAVPVTPATPTPAVPATPATPASGHSHRPVRFIPSPPKSVPAMPSAPKSAPAMPSAPEPAPVTFRDVSPTDYFYDAVRWAVGKNVTQGTSAHAFSPDAPCTRAQAVVFLWRAAGSPAPKGTAAPFRDVDPGAYYSDAVRWAVEQGITGGTGDGVFSPDLTVTRAQTVAFLHRAAGTPAGTGTNPFADVPEGSYYAGAARWASARGLTQGTGAGRFSPDQACTRGQMVSLLYRGTQQSVFPW